MERVVLLTHFLPGGRGLGPPAEKRRLWGEPLALGVAQVLLGALQVTLGGTLLVALGDPLGAQLGAPVGTGPLLMVSGAVLGAMAQRPSVGRARAGLALGVLGAIFSFLELVLQGLLLPHGCPTCHHHMGPAAQGAVLGAQLLLMTSSAAGAALTVTGAVTAARAGAEPAGPPVVIYQTALPGAGAGLSEATPPAPPGAE